MSAPMQFVKASKKAAKLRMALVGPAGSGKTFTALAVGCCMGKRVAVIDTERQSASLYADRFEFDVLELERAEPEHYVQALHAAAEAGYDVVIVDSLSHAWQEMLERVDRLALGAKYKGNSFRAWGDEKVTPVQRALIDALLTYPGHLLATMRTKTAYEVQKDERTGKATPIKVGLAPVQRDGVDYEFSVVLDMAEGGSATVSKTRCAELEGETIRRPGKALAELLLRWLNAGEPVVQRDLKPANEAAGTPAEPGLAVLAGGRSDPTRGVRADGDPAAGARAGTMTSTVAITAAGRSDDQKALREALAARARKLPGSETRGLILRDLANEMRPQLLDDAERWIAGAEAELEDLRRQGDALASRQKPADLPWDVGDEPSTEDLQAATDRARESKRVDAIEKAKENMRAQLAAAQAQAGTMGPAQEPLPEDPGTRPAAAASRRGKSVSPAKVAAAVQQAPVGPSARLDAITGEGDGW